MGDVARTPVRINADLIAALDNEDQEAQTRAFFDVQTGEIEYLPFELEDASLFADVLHDPSRWIAIPRLPTSERRRVRNTFVGEVNDPQVRLQLVDALNPPNRDFVAFERLLRRTPGLSDQWLHHRDRSLGGHARAWLAALGIDAL